MSLIGRKVAVVSMGISCQTAHQIDIHQTQLSNLLGDELSRITMPFDWLMVSPGGAVQMLLDHRTFPRDPCELESQPEPTGGLRKPYWHARNAYFWHEKHAKYADFASKRLHIEENMHRLDAVSRLIFVISNTQLNLRKVQTTIDRPLRSVDLIAMRFALIERWGKKAELWTVSHEPIDVIGVRGCVIPRDRSQWAGDPAAWRRVFEEMAP